ncbi:MAG TPA: hypothetical protein DHV28_09900 [Ignavibacteriales bacterium]|nr:hypothetical protein [Ignavibacteriales bacterium]
MKSILFLFAFSLFFFACDSSVDSNNSLNSIGLVHKIEMSSWMYGTHTLDDSNGKPLYALTSSSVDLNAYENKEVKIFGNLIDGYPVDGGPKYLNVTSITIIK